MKPNLETVLKFVKRDRYLEIEKALYVIRKISFDYDPDPNTLLEPIKMVIPSILKAIKSIKKNQ